LFFCLANDAERCAVFNAAAGVEIFEFGKNVSGTGGNDAAKFDNRSVAYELRDLICDTQAGYGLLGHPSDYG